MLRIHFTGADLARTHVAEGPDPLWETVFSLHMLRARYGRLPFAEWRRRVRGELRRHACTDDVRQLMPLVPDASYFPDFLTPPEGLLGLNEGIEAVVATPRRRIAYELGILHERVGAPSWAQDLTDHSPHARRRLGEMVSNYHARALTPYWPAIRRRATADRAVRVRALHTGGVGGAQGLLASFRPAMRWRPPVLEIPTHPVDRDLHLRGRGLLLVPSQFLWNRPVPLADPELPPTVLYPLDHDPQWMTTALHGTGEPFPSADALDRLLGGTRAAVLRAATTVPNTTELARRVGISPSAASQHAAVLREAGLIVSHRHANSVFHQLTSTGGALLRQRTEDDAGQGRRAGRTGAAGRAARPPPAVACRREALFGGPSADVLAVPGLRPDRGRREQRSVAFLAVPRYQDGGTSRTRRTVAEKTRCGHGVEARGTTRRSEQRARNGRLYGFGLPSPPRAADLLFGTTLSQHVTAACSH